MTFSIAPLLKRQSPSPSYGHGWIMGEDGKRWHPCNDQKALLRGLSTNRPSRFKPFRILLGE
ncbi:phage filamentation protein Fil family protein [Winslowiella toletana]|uniref:phage filamentation protein Fil family protein n=1 Tax=Winslowiella toletana TaxID=92490 RepID=UPI0008FBD1EB|nr:phage filamentation protein Fil family protein [Winslowiella toletana]